MSIDCMCKVSDTQVGFRLDREEKNVLTFNGVVSFASPYYLLS